MGNPIVIAYHIMWAAYGWWLPNDLRGSTSTTIRKASLLDLGELHFGRKKIQPCSRDIRAFYQQANERLKYPLLELSKSSFQIVADGFAEVIERCRYTCYACAIMRDHVHLLIRKHRHSAEEMIENLQAASRLRLSVSGERPREHPTWTRGGWKVFLDHPDEVWRTIKYVDENPIKTRQPRQQWSFVTPYDSWPLHEGHSPNSPYVKALRAVGRYP
jgi:REP element-mobilizing transposase RayT